MPKYIVRMNSTGITKRTVFNREPNLTFILHGRPGAPGGKNPVSARVLGLIQRLIGPINQGFKRNIMHFFGSRYTNTDRYRQFSLFVIAMEIVFLHPGPQFLAY